MRTYRGSTLASAMFLLIPLLLVAPVQLLAVAVPPADAVRVAVPVGSSFRWPLDGVPRLVRRFDPPPLPWSPGHRGVDLVGSSGALVRAAGPGVVLFAGLVAGTPVVSVSHAGGLRTTYQPVQATVRAGDQLAAGDPIGTLLPAHPGCPAEACLHWGLRRGETYLDPLALLGLGRVRLLPVTTRRSPRRPPAGRRS